MSLVKKIIITTSAIGIVSLVSTLFIFSGVLNKNDYQIPNPRKETENQNPEIRGVTNVQNKTSQEELWESAIENFKSYNGKYSTLGKIAGKVSRFGRSFDFEIKFEAFLDEQNSDIRVFSDDDEFFIKSYNSKIYLSEDSNKQNWYELNLSEGNNASGQNISLNNLTTLASLGNDLVDLERTYLGSLNCGNEICQSYKSSLNNQSAEIVVNESQQSIQEVRLNNNGRNVTVTFNGSDRIVEKPVNVTALNSSQSQEKAQSAITNVVRSSIF